MFRKTFPAKKMSRKTSMRPFSVTFFFCLVSLCNLSLPAEALNGADESIAGSAVAPVVTKGQRKSLVVSEYGEISAVDLEDETRGRPYHMQFFTLEPNSLFLPALLHADMVLYVHTGSGSLSWADDDDDLKMVRLRRGDVFRLKPGSVFYIQSDLEPQREKLRLNAIFANPPHEGHSPPETWIGAYSSISDLVRGFDKKTLQAAFKVSEEVVESMTNTTKSLVIVRAKPTKEEDSWQLEAARFLKDVVGGIENKKKKKSAKAYNLFKAIPDFQNCNGWSLTVTKKESHLLKRSNVGIFMVNLTKGAMMGPHWNPEATEISVVLHGSGMVRVVCPGVNKNNTNCKNTRFKVEEGDVFSVKRFHPMAQLSFNNDSFVFMGFSTTTGKNHPQFLAGKRSVLRTLDPDILAVSLNVTNTTIEKMLSPQTESVILECISCAEEEERLMEEIQKEWEEEAAKRREEEEKRRREEEEARKREEEERRKREEEEARRQEEERERRRKEEEEGGGGGSAEEARSSEQEEEAEQEQEEARRQQEERERRRREEEAGGGSGGAEEARNKEREKEAGRTYLKLWRG